MTAPSPTVDGVWERRYGHTDVEYLFLEQHGTQIVGWFCYGTSGLQVPGAPVSGTFPNFSWVPPGSPSTVVRGGIEGADLVIVLYSNGAAAQFRRATVDPLRTGGCATTIASPPR
jgi:hypothetical protein